ncbi:MAG: ketol-acid reductoisomerase [Gammaproteobacteria bacterium]|nr:ketol-acid reductoisomerase [Gammaproteobacteria bacterium]
MTTLYMNDLDASGLAGKRIAVLGYGAQGRAQAQNLKDSGHDVCVGLRSESSRREQAVADGLEVLPPADAARDADVIVMLVPDTVQPEVYAELEISIQQGACLVFAHGYSLHFGKLRPREDLDVVLVAPMGIGEQVREVYLKGAGVPALLAVAQDGTSQARAIAEGYALANGHGHAGVIETTVAEETETDLFAEQAVLCGGMNHLVSMAFETLVEAGYQPEVAYFCCLHEVSFIARMVQRRGIAGMRESISPVAEFGDYIAGPRVINDSSRQAMRDLLAEIRDGRFLATLDAELETGAPVIKAGRAEAREALLDEVGERLRSRMAFLKR